MGGRPRRVDGAVATHETRTEGTNERQPMDGMTLEAIQINNRELVRQLLPHLMDQWFSLEPLPDDAWELQVKIEAAPRVKQVLAQLNGRHL